jgi:myo-inositol-1(or 4)-monophosphatase
MEYHNKWTKLLKNAAFEALKAIKPLIGTLEGKKKHSRGAGGDVTAEIDKVAENVILEFLEKQTTEPFVLISEEIGEYYWDPKSQQRVTNSDLTRNSCSTIIIDPIDGSNNAMRGIPFSCISLALASGPLFSDIKIGVILNIATGDIYIAEKNHGAFLNDRQIHCSNQDQLSKSIISTDFDGANPNNGLTFLHEEIIREVYRIRILGACALELCLIAQGALDLYLGHLNKTRIVDVAAGIIIVQEAGGFVIDHQGNSLNTQKFSLSQRYSLIAGTSNVKSQVVELIAKKQQKMINTPN